MRYLVVLALGIGVVTACTSDPEPVTAPKVKLPSPAASRPAARPQKGKVLATLKARRLTLRIYGGERFDVLDSAGELLAQNISAERLRDGFPEAYSTYNGWAEKEGLAIDASYHGTGTLKVRP